MTVEMTTLLYNIGRRVQKEYWTKGDEIREENDMCRLFASVFIFSYIYNQELESMGVHHMFRLESV